MLMEIMFSSHELFRKLQGYRFQKPVRSMTQTTKTVLDMKKDELKKEDPNNQQEKLSDEQQKLKEDQQKQYDPNQQPAQQPTEQKKDTTVPQ